MRDVANKIVLIKNGRSVRYARIRNALGADDNLPLLVFALWHMVANVCSAINVSQSWLLRLVIYVSRLKENDK
jgi:hypothetical protein